MKKSNQRGRDSGQPAVQQPEKVGWIRKFCGRGIFRELWRNRFVVLRGDHLYVSDKEVRDERRAQEVFNLADYERSEELRKAKSRSKKNHSRFTLLRCRHPGNMVPNLVFLAVSPEEKESWVHALNVAIIKAKNRVLDEVTIEEDSALVHPTRDRVKIPYGRRLPTRGHLMAVASTSSHGMLTLDLVAEEDAFCPDSESWENFQVDPRWGGSCGQVASIGSWGVGVRQRAGTDVSKLRATPKEPTVLKAQSQTPQPGKRFSMQGRSRCASMDEVLSSRLRSALRRCPTEEEEAGGGVSVVQPVGQLQSLIAQRMQRAQELLEEMSLTLTSGGSFKSLPPKTEGDPEVERRREEAGRLLEEAVSSWKEAQEVLQEVKELQSQTLRRQRRRTYEKMSLTQRCQHLYKRELF
uniref:Pleckstrin homology domain containing, family O member 1a n=1 Tax=Gasterosteus aculeatus TaxID=69293 RepID=G3P6E9_GASAC